MRNRNERDQLVHELEEARRRIASLESELRFSTISDALTGLMTVDWFRHKLVEEIERGRRYGHTPMLVLMSVDGLAGIRAEHGLATGDELLRTTARVIRAGTRSSDRLCRSGVDGFELLLPESDESAARACMQRILLELEATQVGAVTCISLSAGIAPGGPGTTASELLERAGAALAQARGAGGGRVACAGGTDAASATAGESLTDVDAVEVLTLALLERDRYTGEHSESVVELAAAVARDLGLDSAEVQRVRRAALLHDVGKVGIPDAILNKPGPLTPEERDIMAEHTVIGERILRGVPGFAPIASIVRHEHERWDGAGYPDGISGEDIPIGSRIILACDAYHAMTSDRPYRKSMSHPDAIAEIQNNAGTQFDPRVAGALTTYLYCQHQYGGLQAQPVPAVSV
jgi:diguanylate cyclase (GGDEF)-like protein/putative nucleotidyltransferase with HDIG domain